MNKKFYYFFYFIFYFKIIDNLKANELIKLNYESININDL